MLLLQTILLAASCAQGYDHGDATADEQLVLEIINRARANPTGTNAEDDRLGITPDITEGIPAGAVPNVGVRPPLAWNKILLTTARAHSRDMYFRNFFNHTNPDGLDPGERLTAAGYAWGNAAENIIGGPLGASTSADSFEDQLMIDAGVANRGHRTNLLDFYDVSVNPAPPYRREIGVGWYSNAVNNTSGRHALMTQHFGRQLSPTVGPFLVGVVYTDLVVANNFYDIGEGVPEVTITITGGGSGTTTSAPGGGFALPIPSAASGTITVTASGGPLNTTLTQVLALTGENIRVEFIPTLLQILDTDGDGIPDFYESRHGRDPLVIEAPPADLDGDGFTDLVEYQRGTNPQLALSTPENAGGFGLPSVLLPGSGSGACGSTGLDVLLLPGLLGFVRRRRRRGTSS